MAPPPSEDKEEHKDQRPRTAEHAACGPVPPGDTPPAERPRRTPRALPFADKAQDLPELESVVTGAGLRVTVFKYPQPHVQRPVAEVQPRGKSVAPFPPPGAQRSAEALRQRNLVATSPQRERERAQDECSIADMKRRISGRLGRCAKRQQLLCELEKLHGGWCAKRMLQKEQEESEAAAAMRLSQDVSDLGAPAEAGAICSRSQLRHALDSLPRAPLSPAPPPPPPVPNLRCCAADGSLPRGPPPPCSQRPPTAEETRRRRNSARRRDEAEITALERALQDREGLGLLWADAAEHQARLRHRLKLRRHRSSFGAYHDQEGRPLSPASLELLRRLDRASVAGQGEGRTGELHQLRALRELLGQGTPSLAALCALAPHAPPGSAPAPPRAPASAAAPAASAPQPTAQRPAPQPTAGQPRTRLLGALLGVTADAAHESPTRVYPHLAALGGAAGEQRSVPVRTRLLRPLLAAAGGGSAAQTYPCVAALARLSGFAVPAHRQPPQGSDSVGPAQSQPSQVQGGIPARDAADLLQGPGSVAMNTLVSSAAAAFPECLPLLCMLRRLAADSAEAQRAEEAAAAGAAQSSVHALLTCAPPGEQLELLSMLAEHLDKSARRQGAPPACARRRWLPMLQAACGGARRRWPDLLRSADTHPW